MDSTRDGSHDRKSEVSARSTVRVSGAALVAVFSTSAPETLDADLERFGW